MTENVKLNVNTQRNETPKIHLAMKNLFLASFLHMFAVGYNTHVTCVKTGQIAGVKETGDGIFSLL
jgi:hypothetical protein